MNTSELSRGRLIDHIQLVVKALEPSKRFYLAILDVLGVPVAGEGPGSFWADELCISSVDSPDAQGKPTGRSHVAFQGRSREQVDAFYRAGLAAGGRDNGEPGERPYHAGYYAAFLLDPDGNNVEAVYHGPTERSAPVITVRYRG